MVAAGYASMDPAAASFTYDTLANGMPILNSLPGARSSINGTFGTPNLGSIPVDLPISRTTSATSLD